MENKLPEGWEWKRLDEVSDIIMGQSPPGDTYNEKGNGMPFLQGKAEFTDSCPKQVKYTTSPSKIAPEGSILISVRAPVGDVNIANLEYCIGRGLASICLKNGDNKFLFYLLRYLKPEIESKGTGSTFKAISKSILNDLIIPLPPLEIQQKIVTILEKAEETKKLRAQADELTQKLLQSVFLEMFGDPVTNPYGFKIGEIGDLVNETQYGTSQKANEEGKGIPILRMNNITYTGNWNLSSLKHIELNQKDMEKYLVYKGELLFNRTNSKELVGKCAVYKEEEPMAFAGYLIKLITDSSATSEFVAGHLNSKYGKLYLENMAKSIVGMANINAQEVQKIPILLPPKEVMENYSKAVEQIEKTKMPQQQSSLEINNLFDALMQKAFNGELVS